MYEHQIERFRPPSELGMNQCLSIGRWIESQGANSRTNEQIRRRIAGSLRRRQRHEFPVRPDSVCHCRELAQGAPEF
jgi:hypothetical protein